MNVVLHNKVNRVHVVRDPLGTPKHELVPISLDGALTVGEAAMLAIDVRVPPNVAGGVMEHCRVVLNGHQIERENDPALRAVLKPGDALHVFPVPGDLGPGFFILLAIALASSIASYVLAPKLGPGDQPTDGDRRFGFDRVSRPAARGEPIPMILGEKPGYGPVRVAAIPGEDAQGNGTLRILYVIAGHRVARIGTRDATLPGGGVADADNLRPGRTGSGTIAGITLNDQPIENYPSARVSVRFGRDAQRPIPGFRDSEVVRDVGAGGTGALLANTSGSDRGDSDWTEAVTYSTVTAGGVDALTLRFRFPQGLYALSSGGGYLEGRVLIRWQWRVRDVGGGTPGPWSATESTDVRRIEQGALTVSARITKPLAVGGGWHASAGTGPAALDVRVQRVTRESNSSSIAEQTRFFEVIESRVADNRYVNCALLAIELTAGEELTSEPRVRVDVKGYDDLRIWDGVSDPSTPTYTRGWSNDPADVLLGVLTDPALRGAGATLADTSIDVPSILEARTRNQELLLRPDGVTRRRRHTCNLVVTDATPVQDLVLTIARTMWAIVQVADKIRVIQDKPRTTPAETFGDGTIAVAEGLPKIASTYTVTRGGVLAPNQVRVQFDNALLGVDGSDSAGGTDIVEFPADGELWLDPEWPGGGGVEPVNPVTVKLEGVTDLDEALAFAIYEMKRRRSRDIQTVFEATTPMLSARVGERIDVASSVCGWGVVSGRLLSGSTAAAVRLDGRLIIEEARDYTIDVTHVDGTLERVPIGLAPGVYEPGSVIPLERPLSITPGETASGPVDSALVNIAGGDGGGAGGAEYAIGYTGSGLVPRLVTGIRPIDEDGNIRWQITCAAYDASVFDVTAADVEAVNVSTIGGDRTAPGPVRELKITSRELAGVGGVGGLVVQLSWRQEPIDRQRTASFRVYRRAIGGGYWQLVPGVTAGTTGVDLSIADRDIAWEFRVVAVSPLGSALSVESDRHPTVTLVFGLGEAPPAAPASATLTQDAGNLGTLSWAAAAGASAYQILYGGVSGTGLPNDGAEDCCVVLARVNAPATSLGGLTLPTAQSTRFWVRSIGPGGLTAGRLSSSARTAAISSPAAPLGESVKHTFTADFSGGGGGAFSNAAYASSRVTITDVDAGDGVWTSPEIDTGSVTQARLCAALLTKNAAVDLTLEDLAADGDVDPAMRIPSIEADQWGVVSGSGASAVTGMLMPPWPDDAVSVKIEVRTSIDGTTYGDWSTLAIGGSIVAVLRYYEVRITLKVRDVARAYRPAVSGLVVVATE